MIFLLLEISHYFDKDFACRKPVPETDPVVLPSEWSPLVKDEPDVFMRIGNMSLDTGDLLGAFGPFWKGLYEKFRDGKGI